MHKEFLLDLKSLFAFFILQRILLKCRTPSPVTRWSRMTHVTEGWV